MFWKTSVLIFLTLLLSACLPQARKQPAAPPSPAADYEETLPSLPAPAAEVHSLQLYRTGDETALPVLPMHSGETLTLEFDLLTRTGRPLSIFFYHTNRNWEPDLVPTEYMEHFNRDELLNMSTSQGTQIPYVHYTYRFPNDQIAFRYSGNYLLRVTEQGDEDAVLFEQAFLVSEENAQARFTLHPFSLGQSWGSYRPSLEVIPPPGLEQQVFDLTTCFSRLPQWAHLRCTTRPPIVTLPVLEFSLLPTSAFPPEWPYRLLDLSVLRAGGDIERVDPTQRPYEVILAPDPTGLGNILHVLELNGQPVIGAAVRDVADPDVMAEYTRTHFRLQPPEGQYIGDPVILLGSFLSWNPSERGVLTWNPKSGYYEGTLLVKQGMYEYRYHAPELERYLRRQRVLGTRSTYLALVYYFDPQKQTDRLLTVKMTTP